MTELGQRDGTRHGGALYTFRVFEVADNFAYTSETEDRREWFTSHHRSAYIAILPRPLKSIKT